MPAQLMSKLMSRSQSSTCAECAAGTVWPRIVATSAKRALLPDLHELTRAIAFTDHVGVMSLHHVRIGFESDARLLLYSGHAQARLYYHEQR